MINSLHMSFDDDVPEGYKPPTYEQTRAWEHPFNVKVSRKDVGENFEFHSDQKGLAGLLSSAPSREAAERPDLLLNSELSRIPTDADVDTVMSVMETALSAHEEVAEATIVKLVKTEKGRTVVVGSRGESKAYLYRNKELMHIGEQNDNDHDVHITSVDFDTQDIILLVDSPEPLIDYDTAAKAAAVVIQDRHRRMDPVPFVVPQKVEAPKPESKPESEVDQLVSLVKKGSILESAICQKIINLPPDISIEEARKVVDAYKAVEERSLNSSVTGLDLGSYLKASKVIEQLQQKIENAEK